jgi:hypothetical protein
MSLFILSLSLGSLSLTLACRRFRRAVVGVLVGGLVVGSLVGVLSLLPLFFFSLSLYRRPRRAVSQPSRRWVRWWSAAFGFLVSAFRQWVSRWSRGAASRRSRRAASRRFRRWVSRRSGLVGGLG